MPEDALELITDTDREVTNRFMKMNEYLDVLIPRGGAGLIRAVVNNATVPVIETGTGNCHIYVDETADLCHGGRTSSKMPRHSVSGSAMPANPL